MKYSTLFAIPAALVLAVSINASAADGKTAYTDSCAKCHGEDGKGQTTMGKKLGARDYTDAKVQASVTDDQAFKSCKEGLVKDGKTLMKPMDLPESDLKAAVAHMRTFKK